MKFILKDNDDNFFDTFDLFPANVVTGQNHLINWDDCQLIKTN